VSYAYRQAGKDWRGRNTGLWTFHADYMREENQGKSEEFVPRKENQGNSEGNHDNRGKSEEFVREGDWKKGFQEDKDWEEMDETGPCFAGSPRPYDGTKLNHNPSTPCPKPYTRTSVARFLKANP